MLENYIPNLVEIVVFFLRSIIIERCSSFGIFLRLSWVLFIHPNLVLFRPPAFCLLPLLMSFHQHQIYSNRSQWICEWCATLEISVAFCCCCWWNGYFLKVAHETILYCMCGVPYVFYTGCWISVHMDVWYPYILGSCVWKCHHKNGTIYRFWCAMTCQSARDREERTHTHIYISECFCDDENRRLLYSIPTFPASAIVILYHVVEHIWVPFTQKKILCRKNIFVHNELCALVRACMCSYHFVLLTIEFWMAPKWKMFEAFWICFNNGWNWQHSKFGQMQKFSIRLFLLLVLSGLDAHLANCNVYE